jgi:HK97 family phage portal protein
MAISFGKFFSRKSKAENVSVVRRGFYNKNTAQVNEDTSMSVSAFHRGVTYVSTQIAKLPWEIKDKDNEILSGEVANLLALAPNPEMNAFMFRLFAVQNAIIHGNSYAEIERSNSGQPIAIWPLPSKCVELVRSTSGDLAYKVSVNQSKDVYLPPRDVFHTRNFHTKDGLVGQGVVQYASETLGIILAADKMASGIFNNGGVPSGVLKHPGTLSDEAYKRLKDSWAEQHGGRKAGGTALLEEGVEYQGINVPPEALQFLESRQFGVLEVARFLGIPPTKLFDITAATYSNVENANLEVATDTLDAWAVNLEMEADIKILNNRHGGRFTELDLYAVFRGDMKTRSEYFKSLMAVGAITPNQIRSREGMAGYGEEGDNYYIATNNFTPVDRMDEVIDAQISGKQGSDNKPAAKPDTPPEDTQTVSNELDQELKKSVITYLTK